jgi:hypothetical protein
MEQQTIMMIGFAILLLGILYLYRDLQALKTKGAAPAPAPVQMVARPHEEKVVEKSLPTKVE